MHNTNVINIAVIFFIYINLSEYNFINIITKILIIYKEVFDINIYTVKSGDSVYTLAQDFGISPYEIIINNGLTPPYSLVPGQSLVISYDYNKTKSAAVLGYAYPNAEEAVLREAMYYTGYLSPFTYGFTEDGAIINLDDYNIRNIAFSLGKQCLMHLSTLTESGGFNSELGSYLLNTPSLWQTIKNNIIAIIQQKGFAGLDIDFEFLPGEDAPKYAEFVGFLKQSLNPLGYVVVTALAPKSSDTQQSDFYKGHDYALLAQNSDYCFLMTYEWGYTYGPPQAISPITGVRNVLNYALSKMAPNKILLGISNYAYDWTLPYVSGQSRAKLIGNEEAVRLANYYGSNIIFDESSASPYFNYTLDGLEHVVWFEDARSIFERFKLIEEFNLSGMGIWNLMRPFTQMYGLINSMFYQGELFTYNN